MTSAIAAFQEQHDIIGAQLRHIQTLQTELEHTRPAVAAIEQLRDHLVEHQVTEAIGADPDILITAIIQQLDEMAAGYMNTPWRALWCYCITGNYSQAEWQEINDWLANYCPTSERENPTDE